jgi:hypothetical protein
MSLLIALLMKRGITSETSVNFYQTTRRNIPEEILITRRRENLTSIFHICDTGIQAFLFSWM